MDALTDPFIATQFGRLERRIAELQKENAALEDDNTALSDQANAVNAEYAAVKEKLDTLVGLVRELEKSSDRKVFAGAERTGVGRRELGRLNAYAEEVGESE